MRAGRRRWVAFVTAAALVAALVPLLPASAAPVVMQPVLTPKTIYVDGTVAGPGTGSAANPFRLLTDGLATAGPGDTVHVAGGLYGETEGETLPFVVPSGVTVQGEMEVLSSAAGMPTQLYGSPDATMPIMVIESAEGVVLRSLVFSDNINTVEPLGTVAGGGISVISSQVSIYDCIFLDLSAIAGGAIAAMESDVSIDHCGFGMNGMALAPTGEVPAAVVEKLDSFGLGGLAQDAANVDAQQPMGACMYGGALLSVIGNLTIDRSLFILNAAEFSGGAVFSALGECRGRDNLFAMNGSLTEFNAVAGADEGADPYAQAQIPSGPLGGGAVSNFGGLYRDDRSYYLMNVGDPGSAVLSMGAGTEIRRGTLIDNDGAPVVALPEVAEGSALDALSIPAITSEPLPIFMNELDIDACVFANNAGPFATYFGAGQGRVTNSLYHGNDGIATVAFWSGVQSVEADSLAPIGGVENCTFSGNTAMGSIVDGDPFGGTILANSILWQNQVGPGLDDAHDVIAWNNDSEGTLSGHIDPSCFSIDPEFRNSASNLFQLTLGSPCVDAGADAAPDAVGLPWSPRYWDIDLLSRPVDGDGDGDEEFDVGAYELMPSGRLGGANRYETAVTISEQYFEYADTVVLATGRTFADGLAGSGLAGMYHAPLLLTDSSVLLPSVADEIQRLGATRVFVLGGENALGPDVAEALEDLGLEVVRIGGQDRYETSTLIAEHILASAIPLFGGPVDAIIARGDLFPDALAAAPVAYANHMPVLLVSPTELPEHTIDVVHDFSVASIVIIGGEAAVSAAVADDVAALAPDVERISGADRYETAAAFAQWARDGGYAEFRVTGVATGEDFADALSGGAGIGAQNGVLLLNPRGVVNADCAAAISGNAGEIITLQAFGGLNALMQSVYDELLALLP